MAMEKRNCSLSRPWRMVIIRIIIRKDNRASSIEVMLASPYPNYASDLLFHNNIAVYQWPCNMLNCLQCHPLTCHAASVVLKGSETCWWY